MTVAKSLPHLWQKVRKLLIPKLFLSYSCILLKNRADRKHEPKNSYICTQENIRKQKMIATTTYHDTYGGSLRSMTMDMMYMRNRFRRV